MPTRKGKKKGSATPKKSGSVVDVRSPADLPAFNDLFQKHTMVIVLVYADYCGHCHTYKDQVWNSLQTLPNKRAGLGSIHYDQLSATPLSNVELDGYPSVLLLGKDMAPAEFKDTSTGKATNSLPDARNKTLMESLVTQEPTTSNMSKIPSLTRPPNVENKARFNSFTTSPFQDENQGTLPFNSKTSATRNRKSNENVGSILSKAKSASPKRFSLNALEDVKVPNLKEDILDTQQKMDSGLEFTPIGSKKKEEEPATGGSLYAALLHASRDLAPAAILTTAAMIQRKKTRRKGGSKARSSTRRRRG
jgi:thiol-disulfide isomerase/thioredoxin